MRGARLSGAVAAATVRIIPADAGSTQYQSIYVAIGRDHPRGCGEHTVSGNMIPTMIGSSPRMRGAHKRFAIWPKGLRIIPADAGSTFFMAKGQCR